MLLLPGVTPACIRADPWTRSAAASPSVRLLVPEERLGRPPGSCEAPALRTRGVNEEANKLCRGTETRDSASKADKLAKGWEQPVQHKLLYQHERPARNVSVGPRARGMAPESPDCEGARTDTDVLAAREGGRPVWSSTLVLRWGRVRCPRFSDGTRGQDEDKSVPERSGTLSERPGTP
ncbi:unnamed protein product [Prorocentrum cordatum]|uniref:Uncharacterized protein n=1 Tax=Prorocentrum cordatum TaxID=2364126 RepID=A0ABN9TXL1_9DINO|nr:unnamed protein product [Polarella glacialis]